MYFLFKSVALLHLAWYLYYNLDGKNIISDTQYDNEFYISPIETNTKSLNENTAFIKLKSILRF